MEDCIQSEGEGSRSVKVSVEVCCDPAVGATASAVGQVVTKTAAA